MTISEDDFFAVQQVMGHVGEDWRDEFDGVYEAAEDWFRGTSGPTLVRLIRELDDLFERVPDPVDRFAMFSTQYAFPDFDSYDIWLQAVRQRAAEAVAGIHSHPLTDPTD